MAKRLRWLGSTLEDLREQPEDVREFMGSALREAQEGGKADEARPMKGKLRDVTEVPQNVPGGTLRLMYTVKIDDDIYVLDFFQKKSKSGIATPQADLDGIEQRLKQARALAAEAKKAKHS